jgi:hypothetical protein
MFPVRYELGSFIPEDSILHSHRLENLKSYVALTGCALYRRRNVFPVRYELGTYIPEDGIVHSDRRENLKLYEISAFLQFFGFCAVLSAAQKHSSRLWTDL